METVKRTDEYKIYQKRSGRYAVKDADGKWLNGPEKTKILVEEKLVKAAIPKPKEESAEEEAPEKEAESAAEESSEEESSKEAEKGDESSESEEEKS